MTLPPVAETLFARITREMEPVLHHIANKEPYEIFMPYRATFNRWSNRVMIHLQVIDVLCRGMCAVCYLEVGRWKTLLGEVETALAITLFISAIYQMCHMTPLYLFFQYPPPKRQKTKEYVGQWHGTHLFILFFLHSNMHFIPLYNALFFYDDQVFNFWIQIYGIILRYKVKMFFKKKVKIYILTNLFHSLLNVWRWYQHA